MAPLSPDDIQILNRLTSRPVRFEAGRTVIAQGEPPEHVIVVVSGWMARYKILGDGQPQIMALMLPGDMCDLHAHVFTAMDHSLGVIGPAEVAMIPRHEIAAVLATRPVLASALWWSGLQNEAILREWITNLGRRDAYRRHAHLLTELQLRLEAAGVSGEEGYDFPLTQTDLADALGMSVVHVNRVLQRLRDAGLVVVRRGLLMSPDRAALAAAADFDPGYLHLDGLGARDPI